MTKRKSADASHSSPADDFVVDLADWIEASAAGVPPDELRSALAKARIRARALDGKSSFLPSIFVDCRLTAACLLELPDRDSDGLQKRDKDWRYLWREPVYFLIEAEPAKRLADDPAALDPPPFKFEYKASKRGVRSLGLPGERATLARAPATIGQLQAETSYLDALRILAEAESSKREDVTKRASSVDRKAPAPAQPSQVRRKRSLRREDHVDREREARAKVDKFADEERANHGKVVPDRVRQFLRSRFGDLPAYIRDDIIEQFEPTKKSRLL